MDHYRVVLKPIAEIAAAGVELTDVPAYLDAKARKEGWKYMFRYFYQAEGMDCAGVFPSLGRAIDAALMDFSSGQTHPTMIQDSQSNVILGFHDLYWIYSRTWNAEYDRVSGAVTPRA